jgi:glycosyltransferase involved in cell wall biosynthesis
MTTRKKLLENHDNDYGFTPKDIEHGQITNQRLSIIIPYYNTGHIFSRCLHFLNEATKKVQEELEIIIVDDGSKLLPARDFIDASIKNVRLIEHSINKGRTEARNTGVSQASGDVLLFIDSDVLVDNELLINHLTLHSMASQRDKKSIVISFFEFTDKKDQRIENKTLSKNDLNINDFRIECTYGETWIGCEEDKKFIGEHMKLIEETNYLRNWKGQYKAWMLPNMVLGGAFSVLKSEINAIGNFDTRFKGYGFTETSAVTRMVAELSNIIIPSVNGGALHIEDELTNIPRDEKDKIFKQKHDFYFNIFIEEEARTMTPKKVIFIDWNRTLSYSLFWEHLKNPKHLNSKHHKDIEKWLFIDNRDIINPWMRGTVSEDEVLTRMSQDTQINKDVLQHELALSCKNMVLCSSDIEILIKKLKSYGAAVVIATDNMDTFRKYTLPALNLDTLFDDILISSEMGVLKDDSEPENSIPFFDPYLSKHGLDYGDVVLLDDSPDSSGKYSKLEFERIVIDSPQKLVTVLENMVALYES